MPCATNRGTWSTSSTCYREGILSLRRPADWEGIGEGFDHSVACGFRRTPERFLCVDPFTARRKKAIIEKFGASVAGVAEGIGNYPAELYAWHTHLEGATVEAAAEFLQELGISNEPAPSHEIRPGQSPTLFMD